MIDHLIRRLRKRTIPPEHREKMRELGLYEAQARVRDAVLEKLQLELRIIGHQSVVTTHTTKEQRR